MKIRCAVTALSVCLLMGVGVQAQEKQEKKQGGQGQAPAGMSGPEMEAMMKAMSPGENHKHLGRLVGNWDIATKMWMQPGQPPSESKATMSAQWILGGRYVQTSYKGEMMGMPFEGMGIDGYDNVTQQYVSTWVDNMGTGILHMTGKCDAGCKTLTMNGSSADPATGQMIDMRFVTTFLDDKSYQFQIFGKDASGQEFKMMEMQAKKK